MKERNAPLDDRLGAAVVKTLATREILVDFRPGAGIRVSPHFYVRDDECDRAVEEIASILASGAWRAHETTRTVVT